MAIRLQLPTEPRWIDLPHGVRVRCRPLDFETQAVCRAVQSDVLLAATREADDRRKVGQESAEDARLAGSSYWRDGKVEAAVTLGAAVACIVEWEGVGDESGAPLPVTDDNIRRLLAVSGIGSKLTDALYAPLAAVIDEGNACAPSPDGSTAPGASTAEPAVLPEAAAPTAA